MADSWDTQAVSSDVPIRLPSQDAYGIDSFARVLARSIATANASDGLVFAVYGPWGSGKSSACNLILHHLQDEISAGRLAAVTFNPWWFTHQQGLTLAFFRELSASIGKDLPGKARQGMASLGARLSSAGPLLGSIAAAAGLPGSLIENVAAALGKATQLDQTVEELYNEIAAGLRGQTKRFLVVIDDIDRLETDEALEVFRLLKSAGRLPNVVYLLAFDRNLAEKMLSSRFPSDGPGYLEKFIQGGFDLPLPGPRDLQEGVLRVVEEVMGLPPEEKVTRFGNLFYEVCAPFLRLPRDAVRLSNAIRVSWPAVRENVDRADFLALEAIRLFLPGLHKAIRNHPGMLCGPARDDSRPRDVVAREYDETFLRGLPSREAQIAKRGLMRLFPRTESVWSNVFHRLADQWQRDRLVCSEEHFPTYFSFSVTDAAPSKEEIEEVIGFASDAAVFAAAMRKFAQQERRRGGTRAALILDELRVHAKDVPEGSVSSLLEGLFAVVDEIDVEADEAKGLSVRARDNVMRVHWLLNTLLYDSFDQATRGKIIEEACRGASLFWLLDISQRCHDDYHPRESESAGQREALVPRETADRLRAFSLERVRAAAADGSLIHHRRILAILFRWTDLAGHTEVRAWTDRALENDESVVAFADRAVQTSWSQGFGLGGFGDLVPRRSEYVDLQPFAPFLDIDRFRRRVQELAARPDLPAEWRSKIDRFLRTAERHPEVRRQHAE
jgi:KAP family P-loop domain.